MSKQPENRVADQQVTRTYKALARERAPEHLNERVLKMAAGSRTPYARARAWMRPAAWAATIALSFAIVLQLTQLPAPETEEAALYLPADSGAGANRQTSRDDAAAFAEKIAPAEAEQESATAQPRGSTETPFTEELAPRAATVMRKAKELAQEQAGADNSGDVRPAGKVQTAAETTQDEPMSMEIAMSRREQANRLAAKEVAQEAASAAAALGAVSDASALSTCLDSQRAAPESWLACIRDLRKRGLAEQADEEYEQFQRQFPEFAESVTDK